MMIEIRPPRTDKEWEYYYDLRFRILREPWGQARGSERNEGDEKAQHFALWLNNDVVAIARMDATEHSNQVQVRFFAVDDQHQGKGFGKKLMIVVEQTAKDQGVQKMILHARENALPFYKAMNYQLVEKSHLLFDTIQHYLMQKVL